MFKKYIIAYIFTCLGSIIAQLYSRGSIDFGALIMIGLPMLSVLAIELAEST